MRELRITIHGDGVGGRRTLTNVLLGSCAVSALTLETLYVTLHTCRKNSLAPLFVFVRRCPSLRTLRIRLLGGSTGAVR